MIKLGELGAFGSINNAGSRDVVQLAMQDEANLTKAGTYNSARLLTRAIFRSADNEIRNNTTRESLLKALGRTLGVKMAKDDSGKFIIDKDFLDAIARALGTDGAKLLGVADFKIKDGHVVGGRPLTERRITAIVNRVYENAKKAGQNVVRKTGEQANVAAMGSAFAESLRSAVASMNEGGWNAAGDTTHKKLLATILANKTGINSELLLGKKKAKELSEAFDQLCSRFATDALGQSTFDEDGFYKDVAFLNTAIVRTLAEVKTINPVDLMKAMDAVDPNALHPGNGNRPIPGFPAAKRAAQRTNMFLQNAHLWMKTSKLYSGEAGTDVDNMGVRDILLKHFANHTVDALFGAINAALQPSGLPVVTPPNKDAPIGEWLKATKGERGLVLAMRKLYTSEHVTFSHDEMRTVLAQAVSRLVANDESLLPLEPGTDVNVGFRKQLNALALVGGGLKGEKMTYRLTYGKTAYESHFEPFRKADYKLEKRLSAQQEELLNEVSNNVAVKQSDKEKLKAKLLEQQPFHLPLTNLAYSSVTKNGRTLVSFTRFGQMALVAKQQLKGTGPFAQYGGIEDQYDDLVKQMVETNSTLQKRIKDGAGKIPIYRIDMTSVGESYMNEKDDHGEGDQMPVLPTGYTVDVRVGEDVKTVTPDFQHLKIPVDSAQKDGEKHFVKVMDGNLPILKGILEKAESAQNVADGNTATMIGKLVTNIRAYCEKYENARSAGGDDFSFQDFRGSDGDAFGVQMMRLGSQVGVLLSLIGDAPAINCNWGRDRTSAMDAMIKQVAIQLDAGEIPPTIFRHEMSDKTKKLNTKMLFDTGNTDVARMTNTRPHNIALNQSAYNDRVQTESQSGFIGLYDYKGTGEKAIYESNPIYKNAESAIARQAKKMLDAFADFKKTHPNLAWKKATNDAEKALMQSVREHFDRIKEGKFKLSDQTFAKSVVDGINAGINTFADAVMEEVNGRSASLPKEVVSGFKQSIDKMKGQLSVIAYREVTRMRLRQNTKVYDPEADPPKLEPKTLKQLHGIARRIADAELDRFENFESDKTLSDFADAYGSLDRQRIENVVFQSLCNDPVVKEFMEMPIYGSEGSVEYSPKHPPHEFLRDYDGNGEVQDKPIENQPGQVANRVNQWLLDLFEQGAWRQKKQNLGDNYLHWDFVRELNNLKFASTVTLMDKDGGKHSLVGKPTDPRPKNNPWLQGQSRNEDDKSFQFGNDVAVNFVKFFEDHVKSLAPNAYHEIAQLVSLFLSGPTGIPGALDDWKLANYGCGVVALQKIQLSQVVKNPSFTGYGDQTERSVSLAIKKDKDGKDVLELRHTQPLALQFEGFQNENEHLGRLKFGVPKGRFDVVMTIPLDQASPGTSPAPQNAKLPEGTQVRNPPRYTLDVKVVPDE